MVFHSTLPNTLIIESEFVRYADRPEVRSWQERMIAYAHETGYTRTLLGRFVPLLLSS